MLSAARLAGLAALLWATAHQGRRRACRPTTRRGGCSWPSPGSAGWAGWPAAGSEPRAARRGGFLALLAGVGWSPRRLRPYRHHLHGRRRPRCRDRLRGPPGAGRGAIGVVALAVATLAVGAPGVLVAEGALSVVVGLMVGASRRQYVERTFQAEQLLAERVRADAERDRAAALAERNRIGREVHDVLAHSLGALSVQLDAADALLENGEDPAKARSWSSRHGGSRSRGWRRPARRCTRCATSRSPWPSNSRRWPPGTAPS